MNGKMMMCIKMDFEKLSLLRKTLSFVIEVTLSSFL
jgi:hypothetical protein